MSNVALSGTVKRATERAILFDMEAREPGWIPVSLIADSSEHDFEELSGTGEDVDILVVGWFADKEGWT